MIKSVKFAMLFRIVVSIYIVVAIIIDINLFNENFHPGAFLFYTIQSNLLVLALFVFLAVKTVNAYIKKTGKVDFSARLHMKVTLIILLTFLVFWLILVYRTPLPIWTFKNLSVHAIIPLLCLLDYCLFSRYKELKYRDVYFVLIYPLIYTIFILILGAMRVIVFFESNDIITYFPYPFMDFYNNGPIVILYIGLMLITFLGLAHVFYYFDQKAPLRRKFIYGFNHQTTNEIEFKEK